MQATEAPVVDLPVMAERKPDHRGLAVQRAILAELRRRELEELDPPGVLALARAIGRTSRPVRNQLAELVEDGLVTVSPNRGRVPGQVKLTPAGRRSADLSTPY